VQKSRLIEKIAELLLARKLPLLEDVRDESAEDVRIVLVPKSRTVDPTILMESLFKLSELESRIPLNMNVLSMGRVPKVMSLKEVLVEWLAHRREVLQRRSRHRLAAIDRRLEILGGYLIAYLNLDEVIRIIREEDEPKVSLMETFSLTDVQAEAILNMRLRSLRKLEEFEIRTEFDTLSKEKAEIESLLASDEKQWQTIAWEIGEVRKKFAKATEIGRRRTQQARPVQIGTVDQRQQLVAVDIMVGELDRETMGERMAQTCMHQDGRLHRPRQRFVPLRCCRRFRPESLPQRGDRTAGGVLDREENHIAFVSGHGTSSSAEME